MSSVVDYSRENNHPLCVTIKTAEETKEFKVIIPEGMEIDKENSTFECIKFKKKKVTYDDIYKYLFNDKQVFFIGSDGRIVSGKLQIVNLTDPNNCTSEKQAQKLLAINKLMNVAKYLNGDWKPSFNYSIGKLNYFICYDAFNKNLTINSDVILCSTVIYFKSEELARQAIDILGEETIKLALSTDW